MSDYWTTPADLQPRREPTEAELAMIEDVLSVAEAWAATEIPTGEALSLVLAEPRAICTAFRFAWHDPRRPALERLHMLEFANRYDMIYLRDFGCIDRATFEMVARNNQWRRTAGYHDDEERAA